MMIYLIGMPGSGKSAIARKLSKKINFELIDLDGSIEKKALMFVDEIFEKYGEAYFRKLETKALENIKDFDQTLVSCGGGVVLVKANKALMNGFIIYIDTDIDQIRERLEHEPIRPILKKKSLETLYDERFLKYIDFADLIVSNDKDIDDAVDLIIKKLKEKQII
jgi:shikimate kinase